MGFKKMRGLCDIPYDEQLYMWIYCRTCTRQKGKAEQVVRTICQEVGGKYHTEDLYQILIHGKSVRKTAIDRHVAEMVLYDLRAKAYKELHRRLFSR